MSRKKQMWLAAGITLGIVAIGLLGAFRIRQYRAIGMGSGSMMGAGVSRDSYSTASWFGTTKNMMYQADDAEIQIAPTTPESGMTKSYVAMGKPGMTSAPLPMQGGFVATSDRTVVKNASMALVVKDVRATVSQVNDIVSGSQGVVTNSQVYEQPSARGEVTAAMVIRVPAAELTAVLDRIRNVATRVTSEAVTAQDQTEYQVDMEAQLRNLQATETQLVTILKQAKTVEETLRVQQEVSNVRSQIERMEAQLKNLAGDAAMATINVTIQTSEAELPTLSRGSLSLWDEIRVSVRGAVQLYRAIIVNLIKTGVVLLPIAAIGLLGWWLFVLTKRK